MKFDLKKFGLSAGVCGLFTFMWLIFSPAETFFANAAELPYVYGEFAGYLAVLAVVIAVVTGAVLALLPDKINRIALTVIFALSVASYIQNMFLNKGLDLMGLNPDGYAAETGKLAGNIVIWVVIFAVIIGLTIVMKNSKLSGFGSMFLAAIQLLALVSLWVSADSNCFKYPETAYHLTGDEQYQVSSKDNIILFIVDCFSNQDVRDALDVKPDALDPFTDFTIYNNMDSNYCGTFPSITHMLTNNRLDFEAKVNAWTYSAWNSDKCNYFYENMKKNGYSCKLYTPDLNLLCGSNNTEELIKGKYDNFTNDPQERIVANKRICSTMIRMASYRMFPTAVKNKFYVNLDEYYDVVAVAEDPVMHENFDFYEKLMADGLTTDSSSNYFMVQHIMGTHLFENDEIGHYKENATPQETALGCLNIVNEYINEMKRLGVYDNATIIITADHGLMYGQQPVFMMKRPGESSDSLVFNTSPLTFDELLPTIAQAAGIDPDPIGETIYKYSEGQQRERTLYIRDYLDEYPAVPCYYGDRVGTANVYIGFTYTGTEDNLRELLFDKPSEIIPMVESYF